MADGRIVIDTKLDSSGLEKGIKSLGSVVKAGIAGLGLASLKAVVGDIATETKALSDSIRKASTLFGNVAVDTDKLRSKMSELAISTGMSSEAIGDALYNALSAGVEVTEDMGIALDFIESSAKTAKGGFADLGETVTATASVLNAYGMATTEATRVQNILMQTQNLGITTVGELASTLSQVIPTASAFNVGFEQIGASLATMTAQGTKTAQATTSLNALLSELGKQGQVASKNLSKASESAGMGAKTFNELISEGYTLADILNLMQDYAEANGLSLVDMFGSIEAGRGALQLASEDGENFDKALAKMNDTGNLVDASFTKVLSNTDRLKNSFNELKRIVGNQFAPAVDSAVGAVADLIENIATNDREAERLEGSYNDLVEALDLYKKRQEEAKTATDLLNKSLNEQAKINLSSTVFENAKSYGEAIASVKNLKEENEDLQQRMTKAWADIDYWAKRYGLTLEYLADYSTSGAFEEEGFYAEGVATYRENINAITEMGRQIEENNALIAENEENISKYILRVIELFKDGSVNINLLKNAGYGLYEMLMSYEAGFASASSGFEDIAGDLEKLEKRLEAVSLLMENADDPVVFARWAGYADYLNEAIERAKSEIDSIDTIPTSSPTSSISAPSGDKYVYAYDPSKIKGNVDEAIGVYSDLRAELKAIATMEELLGDEYDSSEAKASAYRNALEALARAGLDPTQTSVQNLLEEYEKLGKETDELIKKNNVINSTTNILSSALKSLSDGIGNISKRTQELQSNLDSVNSDITDAEEDKLDLEEELLDAQARGDEEAEKRAKKRLEEIEEQIDAYKDLKKSIEDEKKSVESGAEAWNMMGKTALLALAEILDALGHELTARAVTSLLSGNFAGSAMAVAGATTAYLASGGIKNKANSFADGGIVQQQAGVSATGDNHVAFVNAGELILNQAQQENLADQIRAMSESLNNRGGGIYISMKGAYIYGLDEPAVGRAIYDNIEALRAEGVL